MQDDLNRVTDIRMPCGLSRWKTAGSYVRHGVEGLMDRIKLKLRELERDWGFDPHVEIDDSWGPATMRAYGAYTTLLWVREQLTDETRSQVLLR